MFGGQKRFYRAVIQDVTSGSIFWNLNFWYVQYECFNECLLFMRHMSVEGLKCFWSLMRFNPLPLVVTTCIATFGIQQIYVLPTQCIYVFLRGSENKQRLFPHTALTDWIL